MEFSVAHGQGIIRLIFDGFASCLVIRRPVAVNWPDCDGSIGEYYAVSGLSKDKQISMTDHLNQALIYGTEDEIMAGIQDFLQLFETGIYTVYPENMIFDNTDFHSYSSFPADAEPSSEDDVFSAWFYPLKDSNPILTLENSNIHEERVNYYMDLIRKGTRPKVIAFYHCYHAYPGMSASFILDGHHKIQAYIRLKMDIPAIFIYKQNAHYESSRELMHSARLILRDSAFEHLFQNNDENTSEMIFTHDEMMTAELDRILRTTARIDPGMINILIRHHQSDSPDDKIWLNKRLRALRSNINVNLSRSGKSLLTFSRQYVEQHRTHTWFSKTITRHDELESWISETILI